QRLIGVVLGSANRSQRVSEMTKLLNAAFSSDSKSKETVARLGLKNAAEDEGAPPTILNGGACSAAQLAGGEGGTITSAARLTGWGIVFGAYPDKAKAQQVLDKAKQSLGPLAKGGRMAIVQKAYEGSAKYSAMLVGLEQGVAGKACKAMWEKNA